MNNYEFGRLLKLARQQKNLTQEQLASQLDVTVSAISKWENGKNLPDMEMISKISEVLSISLEDLHHPQEMIAHFEGKSSIQTGTFEADEMDSPVQIFEPTDESFEPKAASTSGTRLRVIALASILLMIIASLGILLYKHTIDTPESYITQVAFRITEDEQCGTVYEVACVYNIDLDDITLTSPYITLLSSNWSNDTSVQSDISIMKVSFYETEQDARQWSMPEKSIYLAR